MKTGEQTSDLVTLNNRVFGMPLREDILQRVVVWQLAKRRQGTHCVKTLSEVRGSNRKPFPQKGTGRARQGQKRYFLLRNCESELLKCAEATNRWDRDRVITITRSP